MGERHWWDGLADKALDVAKHGVNTVANVPSSANNMVEGVYQGGKHAILHPIDTARSLAPMVSAVTDPIGTGVRAGMVGSPARRFVEGNPEQTQRIIQTAKTAGDYAKSRYGSWSALGHTVETDPVGAMADFATILSGGELAAVRAPALASKLGAAADIVNPANVAFRAARVVSKAPGVRAVVGPSKRAFAGTSSVLDSSGAYTPRAQASIQASGIDPAHFADTAVRDAFNANAAVKGNTPVVAKEAFLKAKGITAPPRSAVLGESVPANVKGTTAAADTAAHEQLATARAKATPSGDPAVVGQNFIAKQAQAKTAIGEQYDKALSAPGKIAPEAVDNLPGFLEARLAEANGIPSTIAGITDAPSIFPESNKILNWTKGQPGLVDRMAELAKPNEPLTATLKNSDGRAESYTFDPDSKTWLDKDGTAVADNRTVAALSRKADGEDRAIAAGDRDLTPTNVKVLRKNIQDAYSAAKTDDDRMVLQQMRQGVDDWFADTAKNPELFSGPPTVAEDFQQAHQMHGAYQDAYLKNPSAGIRSAAKQVDDNLVKGDSGFQLNAANPTVTDAFPTSVGNKLLDPLVDPKTLGPKTGDLGHYQQLTQGPFLDEAIQQAVNDHIAGKVYDAGLSGADTRAALSGPYSDALAAHAPNLQQFGDASDILNANRNAKSTLPSPHSRLRETAGAVAGGLAGYGLANMAAGAVGMEHIPSFLPGALEAGSAVVGSKLLPRAASAEERVANLEKAGAPTAQVPLPPTEVTAPILSALGTENQPAPPTPEQKRQQTGVFTPDEIAKMPSQDEKVAAENKDQGADSGVFTPDEIAKMPPPGKEAHFAGGRVGYASGGSVDDSSVEPLVSSLMSRAERAKTAHATSTEPLLNAHDNAIAAALHVAQRAI